MKPTLSYCQFARAGKTIVILATLFFPHLITKAQTCPNGSLIASVRYGISATGGATAAANSTGAFLASGSTLSGSNSAISSTTTPLIINLQQWVAQGATLTVAWARNSGTPNGTVSYSNDNITYTTLGTLSGSVSSSSIYTNFTVPAGGLRYIRILSNSGVFFIDGVRYTHSCYYAADGINDTRVVLSPGTAKGDLSTNDLNYDNDAKTYSLYSGVSNGTLGFNSSGAYTYTPNAGFEGVDIFSYILSDAGPDGNIATTTDNSSDTTVVVLRTLFNCDSSTFYVPIPENEAIDFLKDISPTSGTNSDPVNVYIGISVASDAIVIYDQWEDGFETDIKAPTQLSTKIWGDGDPSNGTAPGFPTDILDAGRAIILSNSLTSGHSGSTSYNPNTAGNDATLQGTVDYDGKDKVFIGGIGAMTKLAWGSLSTPSVCGASVPPTKNWGTSYILPVGLNTANSGTSFQITSLSIMAMSASTTVTIDRDANGSTDITVTLGQGETYYLDSRFNGSAVTVNQGAEINATKPIMVSLMTGQYNASPYQSRTFSLIPNTQLSTCYYMPAVPQETIRVFIYNPNASAITVTRTTAGGSTANISVPANSGNFNDVNSSGLGYRYCSSSAFSILATVDYNSGTSDWGFIPVPTSNLTSKVLVGYGDGEDPTSGVLGTDNYSQAMITVDCNTYLYVDTNGDGLPDRVSFNNDVDATDASVSIGSVNYNETTSNAGILLQAYQTITIGATSGSLNGAVFWTKTAANNTGSSGCNIALVWGQNGGPSTTPNIDAGYMVPNIATNITNQINPSNDSVIIERNLDSIKVKYSGAVSPYKVFWFNETTYSYSVFNTPADSFIIDNIEPGNYLIKLRDANCRSFSQRVTINEIPSAPVTGRIYHDANGMSNSAIDGQAISTVEGMQLYAYLVRSNGVIFDSSKVLSNGTYSVRGRQTGNYTVRLSTTKAGFDVTCPAENLPATWVNVAEQFGSSNGSGSGVESGTANGVLSAGIGTTTISAANFSIERTAINHAKTYNISPDSARKYNSGHARFTHRIRLDNTSGTSDTTVSASGTIMPGKVSGIDPEDGRYSGASGSNGKLALTALPDTATNGVLVYNGVLLYPNPGVGSPSYTYWSAANSRYEIASFNPSNFTLFVRSAYQSSTQFSYAYIDNANMMGPVAVYRINYLSPLPMRILLSGEISGSKALLDWTCFNKENVSYYELERAHENDASPIFLASIPDDGSDRYIYLDELAKQASGVYTYLLYSIDMGGKRTLQGTVDLDNKALNISSIHASPTPASSGNIELQLEGFDARTGKDLVIYSAQGQLVDKFHFQGNTIYISTEGLAEGVYFVAVNDPKKNATTSIMIRR